MFFSMHVFFSDDWLFCLSVDYFYPIKNLDKLFSLLRNTEKNEECKYGVYGRCGTKLSSR